jgi:hypothetical protein
VLVAWCDGHEDSTDNRVGSQITWNNKILSKRPQFVRVFFLGMRIMLALGAVALRALVSEGAAGRKILRNTPFF